MAGTFPCREKSRLWQLSQGAAAPALAPLHPRNFTGIGRRRGFGSLASKSENFERSSSVNDFRDFVHWLKAAQLFAKHEELDQRIGRLLGAERRACFGLGLATLAMTGKTGGRRSSMVSAPPKNPAMQTPAPQSSSAST